MRFCELDIYFIDPSKYEKEPACLSEEARAGLKAMHDSSRMLRNLSLEDPVPSQEFTPEVLLDSRPETEIQPETPGLPSDIDLNRYPYETSSQMAEDMREAYIKESAKPTIRSEASRRAQAVYESASLKERFERGDFRN